MMRYEFWSSWIRVLTGVWGEWKNFFDEMETTIYLKLKWLTARAISLFLVTYEFCLIFFFYDKCFGSFPSPPPPKLSGCILFAPPKARARFLHNDLLCGTSSVTGAGCKTNWGHKWKRCKFLKNFSLSSIGFSHKWYYVYLGLIVLFWTWNWRCVFHSNVTRQHFANAISANQLWTEVKMIESWEFWTGFTREVLPLHSHCYLFSGGKYRSGKTEHQRSLS